MRTPVSTPRDVPKHEESYRGPKFHHREWQTDTCSTVGALNQTTADVKAFGHVPSQSERSSDHSRLLDAGRSRLDAPDARRPPIEPSARSTSVGIWSVDASRFSRRCASEDVP